MTADVGIGSIDLCIVKLFFCTFSLLTTVFTFSTLYVVRLSLYQEYDHS